MPTDSIGDYPYNEVTNFGKGNVSEPDILRCITLGTHTRCEQHMDVVVKAPIYATIAKRR